MFWHAAFILILIHSSLLMIGFLGHTQSWAQRLPGYLQHLNLSISGLASSLDYMRAGFGFPIIISSSIVAIVLFGYFRVGRCVHWLLYYYIGSQIILYGLMCAPDVHAYWADIRFGMPVTWDMGWRLFNKLVSYCFITAPIFLLTGRYVYVSLFGPPPLSDASGRYITCTECGYELRGSTSDTCPECGASVLSNKNRN